MENRNGQGIFYGVIGVATLVVAIIGATFAYFNATASTNYVNAIAGNTLDISQGALSISVTKVTFSGTSSVPIGLVPATIANSSGTPTLEGVNQALTAGCVKGGYTGCHVYKIEASSTTNIAEAQINLTTLTTSATVKSDWKYVIYKGSSDTVATSIVTSGSMNLSAPYNMHATDKTLSSTPTIYYLMVYLAEDNGVQNDGGSNDATGTYSGTVELSAAGTGGVTANFTTSG